MDLVLHTSQEELSVCATGVDGKFFSQNQCDKYPSLAVHILSLYQ